MDKKISELAQGFASCTKILTALGDETRQHMIFEMMKIGECGGVRVGTIAEKTNLSRPSVSHHLQVLKNAGIVKVRKNGTKNYYYFDVSDDRFEKMISTLRLAADISHSVPERFEENNG